jgi:hypothetical protein
METITLEIVREGPPEGQVLSSLTRYLALCGNQVPEAVAVPLTHLDFVRRREALRVTHTSHDALNQLRTDAIEQLQRDMTQLVAGIPSLAREILGASAGVPVHLRLVVNPLELAALPFELALAPQGIASTGQSLFTQREHPVIVTRESRRMPGVSKPWPSRPKVLFVWCEPAHDGQRKVVPWKEHLLALVKSMRPWLSDDASDHTRWLRVIGNATLQQVRELCAREQFTHVHLLVHGVEQEGATLFERGYDLAFENGHGQLHRVDGNALTGALIHGHHVPSMVTLASCDSGQVGSILGGHASVAYRLHAEGIALVIAAQLPLSFRASIVLTEVLYNEILSGGDPREALHTLRRRLQTDGTHPWEWASIVAYASLPGDLDARLRVAATTRERTAIDLILDRASQRKPSNTPEPLSPRDCSTLAAFEPRVLARCEKKDALESASAHDYMGSVALRWIDLLVDQQVVPVASHNTDQTPSIAACDVWQISVRAREHYQALHRISPACFWAANVANELDWFTDARYDTDTHTAVTWEALRALNADEPERRSAARLTLLSLDLIHILMPSLRWPAVEMSDDHVAPGSNAETYAMSLLRTTFSKGGSKTYQAFQARRTLRRFRSWANYVHTQRPKEYANEDFVALNNALDRLLDWCDKRDFVTSWSDTSLGR